MKASNPGLILLTGLCLAVTTAATAHAAKIVDQTTADITLLRAYPQGRTMGDLLDLKRCPEVKRYPPQHGYSRVAVDCTAELERKTESTSVIRPFLVDGNDFGQGIVPDLRFQDLPVLELQLVAAETSLNPASAIGLAHSGGWVPVSIPKDQVRQVATVTLKDGRPAKVLRLVAPFHYTGQQGSFILRGFEFKPFIEYVGADIVYRNWDAGPGTGMFVNYPIYNFRYDEAQHGYVPAPERERMDRAAHVLAQ